MTLHDLRTYIDKQRGRQQQISDDIDVLEEKLKTRTMSTSTLLKQ